MRRLALLAVVFGVFVLGLSVSTKIRAEGLVVPRAEVKVVQDCKECPRMLVLPSGLLMSRSHVTVREFRQFVDETGFTQGSWGCVWRDPHFKQTDAHPVVCVSYDDARQYADWLAKKTGRPYRLPTVEEVTYAMRADSASVYWWGQDVGENRANCKNCASKWGGKSTAPAGSFAPSPFGLVDLPGNAWQWTQDCKAEDCKERILVGGAWSSRAADLRTTAAIWNETGLRFNTYGIRVVVDGE